MKNPLVRRFARPLMLTLAAAGLIASTVPAAQATSDAKAGHESLGTTRVAVAPAVVRKLNHLGLTAAPTKNATAVPFKGTVAFRFPITSVESNGNRIKHIGGVKVSSPHDSIALKRFTIKLRQGKVSAGVLVNGDLVGRVDVFNIRPSGRPELGDVRLALTSAAAGAINDTFGAPAFAASDTFGFATVRLS